MSRLELSLDAQHDLIEIATHITSQSGSQKRGEAFLSGVFATCETLASQPAMGELRTEFVTGVYRSFSVGSYVTISSQRQPASWSPVCSMDRETITRFYERSPCRAKWLYMFAERIGCTAESASRPLRSAGG